jgi:hypothetical protein
MFKVYHRNLRYYVGTIEPIADSSGGDIIIDGDLFGGRADIGISKYVREENGIIYDLDDMTEISSALDTEYDEDCKYDKEISLLHNKCDHLETYIKKIEKQYNELSDLLHKDHIKHYEYDEYQSAKRFEFMDAHDQHLFYAMLCICIKAGLQVTYNDVVFENDHIESIGTHRIPSVETITGHIIVGSTRTIPINKSNKFYKFYTSETAKWFMHTNTYSTAKTILMRSRLKDWRCDLKMIFL